ncbi:hypothetical protein NHX12_013711 [Muraenolepis orangiensis]|uniref:Uncharacterized protein n=1 Tax=Muraenolepis orangiensis TaxID=630683 RepID=A0A9Q0DCA5_9TELE|nr:hypothetical protein NHX12_013711 [Muraenolepis orangiensis]
MPRGEDENGKVRRSRGRLMGGARCRLTERERERRIEDLFPFYFEASSKPGCFDLLISLVLVRFVSFITVLTLNRHVTNIATGARVRSVSSPSPIA